MTRFTRIKSRRSSSCLELSQLRLRSMVMISALVFFLYCIHDDYGTQQQHPVSNDHPSFTQTLTKETAMIKESSASFIRSNNHNVDEHKVTDKKAKEKKESPPTNEKPMNEKPMKEKEKPMKEKEKPMKEKEKPTKEKPMKEKKKKAARKKRLCGRSVPLKTENYVEEKQKKAQQLSKEDVPIVVIGETNRGYGQTNNQLNAIFHAQDYAFDQHAMLALGKKGWAINTLQSLFEPSILEETLNVTIVNVKNFPPSDNIQYNRSRHMYWYHTQSASPQQLEQRRLKIIRQLWLHPNRANPNGQDMCSSIIQSNLNHDKPYTVIHVRDMTDGKPGKENECDIRLRNMHRRNGVHPDASCQMSASYIKSILRPIHKLHQPIYVISNGQNQKYIATLRQDTDIGPYIQTLPKNSSWAGADMMFAILADVFIGTPISTFAGNIARARIALGFDVSSNYLFLNSDLQPFCNSTCLFDANIMASYVG